MAVVTVAAVVDKSVPVLGADSVMLTPSPASGLIVSAVKGTTTVLVTSPAANVSVPVLPAGALVPVSVPNVAPPVPANV